MNILNLFFSNPPAKQPKAVNRFVFLTLVVVMLLLSITIGFAQNIGINTTGNPPNPSALLDVDAAPVNDKGLLIPRLTTTQRNTIASPAHSLLIYNTTTDCFEAWNQTTSQWVAFGCINCQLPGTFTANAASNLAATSFDANWSASAGTTAYFLDVAIDAGFTTFVTGYNNLNVGNVLTLSVTGLSCGTYYYRLRANNTCATSTNSNTITATTNPSTSPAAPTATAATGITQTSFDANWSASAGATTYYLDVATDIAFTAFVTGYNNLNVGNVLTASVTGLTCETDYYYRIRAGNACGTSANSNTVTVTTNSCITPGIIVAWSGTLASIPTGWTLCDGTNGTPDLRDNFIKGAPPATDAGGTGGTLTHNHAGVTGTTNLTTGASGTAVCGVDGASCSWLANAQSHTHPYNHSHVISSASNLPPYYQVAFIMSTSGATSMTPNGIIAVWSGTLATIPANWILCDGAMPTVNLLNLFLQGSPASTNPGASGGNATHDHGGTAVDNTPFTPLFSQNGTGNCGIGCASWGGNAPGQGHDHTYSHSHSVSSASNLPPYFEVAFTMANNATFIPSGLIAQWSGTLATIPAGWVLCDGSLSTPDLTNRFVKGVPNASTNPGTIGGSSASHDHGGVTGIDPGGTSSTNGATNGLPGGTSRMAVHSHSVPSHSHTISSDGNEPPYYKIVFIMKQ